ncbi:MAG TPA: filamentous hemagglutinin N-terminal domain-containing protein [Candidatus Acidoferrum sp.]|jgi:filamentous hemagglutinin family protein|nr:filamentous hemagglutinin N-terminal domain-containing protein [Candidatus Acidoferrum sp.]
MKNLLRSFCGGLRLSSAEFLLVGAAIPALANPVGGTVSQGSASFSARGPQLSIQTSDHAFINWQSFNIGLGETTTFVQPSSSSLVWNQIHDSNPSQILGDLHANGYVVLQNQSGFYIGGQASITAHGLLLTTSPIPIPDLSSGGPWSFNAPPPSASIVNYGQISTDKGGSVFLLAHDIDNHGSISAPEGSIGLYAGKEVLLSERPDGRGLTASLTLPEGSVDNSGKLIADAGSIALRAQVVNVGGLVQANSIREVNGVIELVANDAVNLGPNGVISAKGDAQGTSPGGQITIKSFGSYSDQPGSLIDISGGARGGNGGQVEISAPQMSALQANIDGQAYAGFLGGKLFLDPLNIILSSSGSTAPSSGTVGVSDPPAAGTLTLNINSFPATLSQITLQAANNIELSSSWTLSDSAAPAALSLSAGNNITLDNGSSIAAGKNWTVNMTAGPQNPASRPAPGTAGIYLNGNSFIQTENGSVNLWAANEVLVNTGSSGPVGINGIRTRAGGSISVTTLYGDVNSGANPQGLTQYRSLFPYYTVSRTLGGISTMAGGDVSIDAIRGNVFSYLPLSSTLNSAGDAGSGAFGSLPGNVTITAGGSVYGHYVLANGVGSIIAGQNVGGPDASKNVALSLIAGSWNVNSLNGSIYLQEVRNPNGVFNNAGGSGSAGYHYFNYAPDAAVDLTALLGGVYLTCLGLPRPGGAVPVIFPPTLDITAGAAGVHLQDNVILFPSANRDLIITTTGGGSFSAEPNDPSTAPSPELIMSDSSHTKWIGAGTFGDGDHGAKPLEVGNPAPAILNISGDMRNLILFTSKQTRITVGGDMVGCSFSGQNLHPTDITSINVAGQIVNRSPYSFVFLDQAIGTLTTADLPPGTNPSWNTLLSLAMDPAKLAALQVPPLIASDPTQLAAYAARNARLFSGSAGFVYNPTTKRLGFSGQMSAGMEGALEQPLTVLRYGPDGFPIIDSTGHFVTDKVAWVAPSDIASLFKASQGAPSAFDSAQLGYRIGGPGNFNVHAGSISLGNTYGILSCGVGDPAGDRYANLASLTPSGATVNVTVDGNLDLLTSTIAALGGGSVNVTSTGGRMDLGSQELLSARRSVAFGIYTSGSGDVNVVSQGDINVEGSRIAAYNGGNITVRSLEGNVNAGSGGTTFVNVPVYFVDPATGQAKVYAEVVFGSGILANTLVNPSKVPGSARLPGNITVDTPRGDILASLGGITQEALNGDVSAGPTITLVAGTPPSAISPGYKGNIDLGDSGVIGGTVNATANGNISGLVISRQNSEINAVQSFSGTVLSGGTANLTAGGTISGTVVGIGGINASGGQGVSASLLSQNVSVGGVQAQSTLGTSATATTSSQSAAQQANSDAQQQVASNNTPDDDEKKKKGKEPPALVRRVGRVTVILPPAS